MTGVEENLAKTVGLAVAGLIGALVTGAGVPGLIYIGASGASSRRRTHPVLANHDTLTKLLNRSGSRRDAGRIFATCRATRERLAVWAVDIKGLGDINKTVNQAGGDELLRTVADRLMASSTATTSSPEPAPTTS